MMVNALNVHNSKIRLIIIIIAYFSLSLYFLFVKDFKYLIDPDTTSYISIAQKYLEGDFANAVNGQWSPLASWLMIPLLLMKVRPMLALQLSSIIVGGFTLAGINLLMYTIGVRDNIRFVYVLSLSPLIAYYTLTQGNPDLLSLCILIYYLYIMIREDFKTSKYRGIVAGLVAGIAYLSKSYNFYFFLLHFTLSILLYWYSSPNKSQRKVILINGLSAVLIFLLVSSPWIGSLTNKYNKFTITTAGDYNFSFDRPGSPGHMPDTDGLMVPTNETAFSAWEDPTYIKKVAWSPFQSGEDFQYFIKNIAKNAAIHSLYLSRNPVFFFTIVYFIILLIHFRSEYFHNKSFYLFFVTFLHPIGFLMLHVEERYLYINYILLYILGGYIIDKILRKTDFIKLQKTVLVSIVCGYMAILPIAGLFYWIDKRVTDDKNIYFLSKDIMQYNDFQNANIASQVEKWRDDVALFYYLKAKYYGKVKEGITDEELKNKLLSFNIQYYFVHGELKNHLDILKPLKKFDDITIYEIVEPADTNSDKIS